MPPSRGQRTSEQLCTFYDRGKCTNDINCRFKHGPNDPRPLAITANLAPASLKVPCRYYPRCTLGSQCPYAHSAYDVDEAARRRHAQQQQRQQQQGTPAGAVPSRAGTGGRGGAGAAAGRPQVFPPAPPAAAAARGGVDAVAERMSNLTVLGKPRAAAAAAAAAAAVAPSDEVEWEFPSDTDAYFYGAAGTFAQEEQGGDGAAASNSWTRTAIADVPEEVLAAEAQADQCSRAAFEHSQAARKAAAQAQQAPRDVCKFFMKGTCRFGAACRNAHPFDDASEAGDAAEEARAQRLEKEQSAAAECGICYDKVSGRFGILTGCDHPFCLDCIRNWRAVGVQSQTAQSVRTCPLCRTTSHFIVPSARLVSDPQRKAALIERYKASLSAIPCRYFKESGECPFGGSCFYAHLAADGSRAAAPRLRVRMGAEGDTEVQGEVRLSSFIEQWQQR